MNKFFYLTFAFFISSAVLGQHIGIVRKNYFSTVFDPIINANIEQFDSSTIRLGTVDPLSGVVSNLSEIEYPLAINLTGATINPYSNHYYIGSGLNLLTFDISSGNLINSAPISGEIPSAYFQNYRFNPSDTTIYGMIPQNFYSVYFDSLVMSNIEVLDSTQIRFGSINPSSGVFTLIGNTSYNNIYTLAGNSIDPFQMVYYYSAVNKLIGIDLYNGAPFSVVNIQLPVGGIFENIAYSCADTSIYGLTRQSYVSTVYDEILMEYVQIYDSTTFRLSKIDPNTGVVTFISPYNIQAGGNLTGGAFIDPATMTYFFNHGNKIVGVSMITGLITSSVIKSYPSGEIAFDMMRSTQNCYGVSRMRNNSTLEIDELSTMNSEVILYPNPVQNELNIKSKKAIQSTSIVDLKGNVIIESNSNTLTVNQLPNGVYFAKVKTTDGGIIVCRFIKN
jgi:hypothetical protein